VRRASSETRSLPGAPPRSGSAGRWESAHSPSVKALRRDGKERTFSRFKKGARDSLGSSGLEPASDQNEALEKIRKLLAHLESGKASDGFAVTGYSRALDDLNKLRDEAINGDADVDTKTLVRELCQCSTDGAELADGLDGLARDHPRAQGRSEVSRGRYERRSLHEAVEPAARCASSAAT